MQLLHSFRQKLERNRIEQLKVFQKDQDWAVRVDEGAKDQYEQILQRRKSRLSAGSVFTLVSEMQPPHGVLIAGYCTALPQARIQGVMRQRPWDFNPLSVTSKIRVKSFMLNPIAYAQHSKLRGSACSFCAFNCEVISMPFRIAGPF